MCAKGDAGFDPPQSPRQRGEEKRQASQWGKELLHASQKERRTAPSPLTGEGWGGVVSHLSGSPTRGEMYPHRSHPPRRIRLRQTRPFVAKEQGYLIPKKSVFNKIIGDSHFELLFARFLEDCDDVVAFAKNYLAVRFTKLDYVKADGDISNYYPDFLVKLAENEVCLVETKQEPGCAPEDGTPTAMV